MGGPPHVGQDPIPGHGQPPPPRKEVRLLLLALKSGGIAGRFLDCRAPPSRKA